MSSLCEQHHCDCCVTDTFLWRDAVKQGHTELHTVLSVTVSVKVHKIGSVTVGYYVTTGVHQLHCLSVVTRRYLWR